MSVVTQSRISLLPQMFVSSNDTARSNEAVEKTYTQPSARKKRSTPEEVTAKSNFRQQSLTHRLNLENPYPSREEVLPSVFLQRTPTGQKLQQEAESTKGAFEEWAKAHGAVQDGPPLSATQHIDSLQAVFARYDGDALLATATSQKMKALEEVDLNYPSPQVVVPKESTLYPWKLQVSAAFTNRILSDWAVAYKVDPDSLRYDTSTNIFHAKTPEGKVLSYTPSEFASQYPAYKQALDPIVDVATVVAPKGGVELKKYPADSASLDLILSFYGLDPNEKSLDKIHETAKKLHRDDFPNVSIEGAMPSVAEVAKHRDAMEQKERAYIGKLEHEEEPFVGLDLERYDADSVIAKSAGDEMAKMDNARLRGFTPQIDIHPKSSLFPWLQQVNAAFDNNILKDWAENYDINLSNLKYSPSMKLFGVQTVDGENLTFTAEEFAKTYAKYSDGLEPIVEVANVVAPGKEVILGKSPDNKAGLDLVQSFYGLDPNERNIEKINDAGRKLSSEQEFGRQPEIKERSQQALSEQKQSMQAKEAKYRENLSRPVGTYPASPKEVRAMAETEIAESTADAMLRLTEDNKYGEGITIKVPEQSKLYPWLFPIDHAFQTLALLDWATEYKIDPASFSYDTSAGKIRANTLAGQTVEYTTAEFATEFKKYSQALTPIVEVAKVVAPKGGVTLKQSPEGSAPLDVVLGFYGLNPKEQYIKKTHEIAKVIKREKTFPEQPDSPDRSKKALDKQSEIQRTADSEYYYKDDNPMNLIESNGRGGGVTVPGKI